MSRGLRHFGSQTALYAVGGLVYRGASLLLVPLYTHLLPATEYGKLELLSITTFILQSILSSGVSHSVMRYYFEFDDESARKRVVSTAFFASFGVSSSGSLLVALLSPWLSSVIYGSPDFALAFVIAATTMTLETSREISLSLLRAQDKALLFIGVGVVQFVVQVIASYYTVAVLGLGMNGVLLGNLTAVGVIWLVLTSRTVLYAGIHWDSRLLKPLVAYGAPMTLNGLTFAGFQAVDRYTLNAYATFAQLGQYALALRIATGVTALIVDPFKTSYGPFRLSIMRQENAKAVYARVLTYYVIGLTTITVAIGAASHEIVRVVSQPEYWPAAQLVPLLLIAAMLSGVDYCFQTGILIEKRTDTMFYATLVKGAFHFVMLVLFVPRYGVVGSGLAQVASGCFGVTVTYWIAQRAYRVPYEYSRLLKTLAVGLIIEAIALSLTIDNLIQALAVKIALVLTLPFVLVLFGCISGDDLRVVDGYRRRMTGNVLSLAAALRRQGSFR